MPTLQVAVDVKRGIRGLNQFSKALGFTGKSALLTTRAIAGVSLAAAAAGALVLKASKSFAAFDDQMRLIQSTSGATAKQIGQVEAASRRLGRATRLTGAEGAAGFLQMSRAGVAVNDQLGALPEILNLAAAQMSNLEETTKGVLSAMGQFGIATEDAANLTDVFQKAATSANITLESLFQSLKLTGAASRSAGESVEETAAAIAVLGDAGIRSTMAGTNLRGIIGSLIKPSQQARKELASLGLSVADIDVSSIGLEKSFRNLKNAGADVNSFFRIFTLRNVSAADVLTRNIDILADLEKQLLTVGPAAEEAAKKVEAGLGGAFRKLDASFQSLSISIGKTFENDANNFARSAAKVANGLSRVLTSMRQTAALDKAAEKQAKLGSRSSFEVIQDAVAKRKRDDAELLRALNANVSLDRVDFEKFQLFDLDDIREGGRAAIKQLDAVEERLLEFFENRKGGPALPFEVGVVENARRNLDIVRRARSGLVAGQAENEKQKNREIERQNELLQIQANIDEIRAAQAKRLEESNRRAADSIRVLGSAAQDAFFAAIEGGEGFKEAMKGIADSVIKDLFRILVTQRLVNGVIDSFGVSGTTAPSGGAGGAGNPGGGTAPTGTITPGVTGKSRGGYVQRFGMGGVLNQRTRVGPNAVAGEGGRKELILPVGSNSSGEVGIRGGGGGLTMIINTPNADSFRRSRRQVLETVKRGKV